MKREVLAGFAEDMLRGATLRDARAGECHLALSWEDGGRKCELIVQACLDGMLSYQFTMDPPKGTGGEG